MAPESISLQQHWDTHDCAGELPRIVLADPLSALNA
jgi:hypothetical protein